MPATPEPQLLRALRQLDAKKDAWVALSDSDKAQLLRSCLKTTMDVRGLACSKRLDVSEMLSETPSAFIL